MLLFIWIASALAACAVGARKGNPISALFIGILFGPLGLIAAILSGYADKRDCPFCAEMIMKKAKVCPFCRNDVPT